MKKNILISFFLICLFFLSPLSSQAIFINNPYASNPGPNYYNYYSTAPYYNAYPYYNNNSYYYRYPSSYSYPYSSSYSYYPYSYSYSTTYYGLPSYYYGKGNYDYWKQNKLEQLNYERNKSYQQAAQQQKKLFEKK